MVGSYKNIREYLKKKISKRVLIALALTFFGVAIASLLWVMFSMVSLKEQTLGVDSFVNCSDSAVLSNEQLSLSEKTPYFEVELKEKAKIKYFCISVRELASANVVSAQIINPETGEGIGKIDSIVVGENYSDYLDGKFKRVGVAFTCENQGDVNLAINQIQINKKRIVWHVALQECVFFFCSICIIGIVCLAFCRMIKGFKNSKIMKSSIVFCIKSSGILLFGSLAILKSDFIYIDDYQRIMIGYTGDFDWLSRYFAKYLCFALNATNSVFDISPLNQIMTILFMAIAYTIIVCCIAPDKLDSNWMLLGIIPFGLSPYFLECLSYKVESLMHGTAVLVGILPLVRYKQRDWKYMLGTAIGTMLVAISYQASLGIYPVVVVLILANEWCQGEEIRRIVKLAVNSVCGWIIGLVLFKVFLMKEVDMGYSGSNILPINKLFTGVVENYRSCYMMMNDDFSLFWKALFVVILGLYVICFVTSSKRDKKLSTVVAFGSLLLMFLLCYGIYPVLEVYYKVPRAIYEFFIVISLMEIFILSKNTVKNCDKVVCAILGWCFVSLAFAYGNCLSLQSDYTSVKMQAVINYLNENVNSDEEYNIQLRGGIGYSPVIHHELGQFHVLYRLVPQTLGQGWYWSEYRLRYYYGFPGNCQLVSYLGDEGIQQSGYVKTEDMMWFDVYQDKSNNVVIDLSQDLGENKN